MLLRLALNSWGSSLSLPQIWNNRCEQTHHTGPSRIYPFVYRIPRSFLEHPQMGFPSADTLGGLAGPGTHIAYGSLLVVLEPHFKIH